MTPSACGSGSGNRKLAARHPAVVVAVDHLHPRGCVANNVDQYVLVRTYSLSLASKGIYANLETSRESSSCLHGKDVGKVVYRN